MLGRNESQQQPKKPSFYYMSLAIKIMLSIVTIFTIVRGHWPEAFFVWAVGGFYYFVVSGTWFIVPLLIVGYVYLNYQVARHPYILIAIFLILVAFITSIKIY